MKKTYQGRKRIRTGGLICLAFALQLLAGAKAVAEDGYRLWLRYDPLPATVIKDYRARVNSVVVQGQSPTLDAIRAELVQGCTGLLGNSVPLAEKVERDGAVVVGTPSSSPLIDGLGWGQQLAALGPEGFRIRSVKLGGRAVTVIASRGEAGALYGAFHLLRLIQTQQPISNLDVSQKPRLQIRVLDHWDNLDRSVERGYAGRSLWDWEALPQKVDPRLVDYARANASVGINGSVLNNVNANSKSLSAEYLQKTKAIADAFRPYGVRVYLSARFSSPIELDGLKTADPLDPEVAAWWRKKADEIYKLIPDFGGFLVKANSEGQPGPRTYGRNHLDGANMMAAALAPHGGVVIWRAFVYDAKPGYDRAAAAYEQLQPFDGKFAPNVLLQVKNGAIDFQPREPFHPLFGAMPKTQMMLEAQITQEYLGHSNHLVFLAPMWREVLDSDTHAKGPGSTVTKVLDGSLFGQRLTGMAGVANTGTDRNWTGHHFAQSNWYAFGRLAWNPDMPSRQIADEWIQLTLTHDPKALAVVERVMLESHEALVDYMTPLGLHHIMWGGHHYGPAPWENKFERADWNPVYYHKADAAGIGFDRTPSGSNAVAQYSPTVRALYGDPAATPEKYLLWFHHVPWDRRMRSGRTLWDELALRYQRGVDWVRAARKDWDALSNVIDPERHAAVKRKLELQERDAVAWRDACLLYFQTISKRPLPAGVEPPQKTLEEYKAKSILSIDSSSH
ncbi:MAG TPA: alpha-glucuronidase family glycosyl hydrolase [Pyrinomonadaceae bacterium]|jgi:alpha-glucuronidase|nr:alpha-glucuronidase family glycosyl hydrolase [Pyrinomonadaceae bacterium]